MLTNGKIIHRLATRPSAAAELRQCRYEIGVDTYSGTRGSRTLPRRYSRLQRVSWNPCTADRRPERTPITMSAHDQVRYAHESLVKMTASNIEGRVDWAILGRAPTRLVAITTWARNGRHLSPSADQIWLSPCILKTRGRRRRSYARHSTKHDPDGRGEVVGEPGVQCADLRVRAQKI